MADLSISLTSQLSAADLKRIGDNLAQFNEGEVGPSQRESIAVLAHADETMVAGLSGHTAWSWLYVQWLWIAETHRGQGLAGKMLEQAEAEAHRRGCHGAYIDTFSPQALHVYQKAGYSVFGTLDDFPPGRTRSFLSKTLP